MRTGKHWNTKVYNTMHGPNEFFATGNYKDWDRWSDLTRIRMPALLVVGRYDEISETDAGRWRR